MDQDAKEVGLGPGNIVLDGAQRPPPTERGTAVPPTFWPMSIVARRSFEQLQSSFLVPNTVLFVYMRVGYIVW